MMRPLLALLILLSAAPAFAADGGLLIYPNDAGDLVQALPDGGALDVPLPLPIDAGDPSPYTGVVMPTARAAWIAGRIAAADQNTAGLSTALDAKPQPMFAPSIWITGMVCLGLGLVGGVYLGVRMTK